MATRSSKRETLTSEQLYDLTFLSDPHLACDASRAFCVRTTIDAQADETPRYRSTIIEIPVTPPRDPAAATVRDVAGGEEHGDATHPRLDERGRYLAFLSTPPAQPGKARGATNVKVLDLHLGGEARTVTKFEGGVKAFAWRPGSHALLVVAREAKPEDGSGVVARTVTRLHAKQDGVPHPGLTPEEPLGAWLVNVPSGRSKRLPVPADGVSDVAWHPSGQEVWMLGGASIEEADEWRTSLWRLPLTSAGAPAGDLEERAGGLSGAAGLAVDAEGTSVAWLASSDPDDFAAPTGLWTLDVTRSRAKPSLRTHPDVDVSPALGGDARFGAYPNRPVSTAQGWLVNVNEAGASSPGIVQEDGTVEAWLPGEHVVTSFRHAAGTTLYLRETPQRPGVLSILTAHGRAHALYDPNAGFVEKYQLRNADGPFAAPSGGGSVAWWRLRPRRTRRDHALVLQVHGGPHTNAGWGFSFEHHLLAAHGYTVVFSNPRGSSSYGMDHATAMIGGYGTVDADDVLAVADHALSEHRNPNAPMHLTGGSYGGFMTNWLVGRTDRFRSAVTQRSICNWLSFYGTSDIGYRFAEHEVQGNPWNDFELLWRQSPLRQVANVTTPILIVHAEADHRCPIEQAEQWYVALKRLGKVDTKLVRFPGESHELSRSGRPDRRVRRLQEIVAWFETHA